MKKTMAILIILWVCSIASYTQTNYALQFDGSNDNGLKSSVQNLGSGNTFTYETWAKLLPSAPGFNIVFDLHTIQDNNRKRLLLMIDNSSIKVYCNLNTSSDNALFDVNTEYTMTTDQWYHIAFVLNNGQYSVYVNGALQWDISTTAYTPSGSENLYLCCDYWDGGHAKIQMDEFRVWNVARSQSDIQSNMYNQLTGSESGLKVNYNMNEGSGSTLADNSGNGNDATLYNDPEWISSDVFYPRWTGATSSSWNVTTNWNVGRIPQSTDNVIIEDQTTDPVILSGDAAVCNNLTIASGATLTIGPGMGLTVNGTLTNNAGTGGLVVNSDATGTGSLKHSISGVEATVKLYISGSASLTAMKYHFVSIPMNITSPTSNLFLGSYLCKFDQSSGSWVNLGTSTTTPLELTRGYMIYYPGENNTYSFTGTLNTGSFTALTSYNSGYGYNLVPNPYPSAIDWNAISGWTKQNIAGTIYFWPAGKESNSNNYAIWNGTTGINDGTQYIPVGQAFIIQATESSQQLSTTDDVRVHSTQAFWKSTTEIQNLIKIKSVAAVNQSFDELAIHFRNGATCGFDAEYDANKLQGGEDAPQFYSTDQEGNDLAINSLPLFTNEMTIPLRFSLNSNSEITLTANSIESFDDNVFIILEDQSLKKMINLRKQPVYVFTYEQTNPIDRFLLHINKTMGINNITTVEGSAFILSGRIFFEIPEMGNDPVTVILYNVTGQILYQENMNITKRSSIEVPPIRGVFLLRIFSENKQYICKIINQNI